MDKEVILEYIKLRIAQLTIDIPHAMKNAEPKKREMIRRQLKGRILELVKLRELIEKDGFEEYIDIHIPVATLTQEAIDLMKEGKL